MNWIDFIAIGAFVALFLVVYWLGMTAMRARQRIRHISQVGPRLAQSRPSKLQVAIAGAIPGLSGEFEALEQDLKRAGYYGPYAMIEYLFARNVVVIGLLIAGGSLAVAVDPLSEWPARVFLTTVCVAGCAYVLPRLMLSVQSKRRVGAIQRGLPDALDIVRMTLTGGLSLRDSLERVSQEVEFFHPDIAVELEVVRRHGEADTMSKALREFAKRLNTTDVSALASLVSQTERTGTYAATAITEFADSVRRQSRQRAEERASKTSVKLLFPVLLCLSPPVFLLLLGPPVLQLRNFVKDAHQPGGVLDIRAAAQGASASSSNSTADSQ